MGRGSGKYPRNQRGQGRNGSINRGSERGREQSRGNGGFNWNSRGVWSKPPRPFDRTGCHENPRQMTSYEDDQSHYETSRYGRPHNGRDNLKLAVRRSPSPALSMSVHHSGRHDRGRNEGPLNRQDKSSRMRSRSRSPYSPEADRRYDDARNQSSDRDWEFRRLRSTPTSPSPEYDSVSPERQDEWSYSELPPRGRRWRSSSAERPDYRRIFPELISIKSFQDLPDDMKQEFIAIALVELVSLKYKGQYTLDVSMGEFKDRLRSRGIRFESSNTYKTIMGKLPDFFQIHVSRSLESILPRTNVKICQKYTSNVHVHVTDCGCNDLHVCKFYLIGHCMRRNCKFNHDMELRHNQDVLTRNLLHRMSPKCIGEMFMDINNRNSTTLPTICRFYNNEGGCKYTMKTMKTMCNHLHICKHFVNGDCKFGQRCKRDHDFQSPQSMDILNQYGLSEYSGNIDVLVGLLKENIAKDGSIQTGKCITYNNNIQYGRYGGTIDEKNTLCANEDINWLPIETISHTKPSVSELSSEGNTSDNTIHLGKNTPRYFDLYGTGEKSEKHKKRKKHKDGRRQKDKVRKTKGSDRSTYEIHNDVKETTLKIEAIENVQAGQSKESSEYNSNTDFEFKIPSDMIKVEQVTDHMEGQELPETAGHSEFPYAGNTCIIKMEINPDPPDDPLDEVLGETNTDIHSQKENDIKEVAPVSEEDMSDIAYASPRLIQDEVQPILYRQVELNKTMRDNENVSNISDECSTEGEVLQSLVNSDATDILNGDEDKELDNPEEKIVTELACSQGMENSNQHVDNVEVDASSNTHRNKTEIDVLEDVHVDFAHQENDVKHANSPSNDNQQSFARKSEDATCLNTRPNEDDINNKPLHQNQEQGDTCKKDLKKKESDGECGQKMTFDEEEKSYGEDIHPNGEQVEQIFGGQVDDKGLESQHFGNPNGTTGFNDNARSTEIKSLEYTTSKMNEKSISIQTETEQKPSMVVLTSQEKCEENEKSSIVKDLGDTCKEDPSATVVKPSVKEDDNGAIESYSEENIIQTDDVPGDTSNKQCESSLSNTFEQGRRIELTVDGTHTLKLSLERDGFKMEYGGMAMEVLSNDEINKLKTSTLDIVDVIEKLEGRRLFVSNEKDENSDGKSK